MTESVKEACPKACKECPWRLVNQGKRHPHSFYSKRNLARLWAGLRRGVRMSCHPTDPQMASFTGYEQTAGAKVTHECTGALILVQREFARFQRCCAEADQEGQKDGIRRYRRRYPKGLLPEGLTEIVTRFIYGKTSLDGLPMACPNLNMEGIGHPDLTPWDATVEGVHPK